MEREGCKPLRKRQLATRQLNTSCLASCSSKKRQRQAQQQVDDQEDADLLILDIDLFTVRQLEDALKN
jgi:hypothetical protein